MSRVEENDELINGIYEQLNEHPFIYDIDVKTLAILDISKSLAVIADELRKEDKEDD